MKYFRFFLLFLIISAIPVLFGDERYFKGVDLNRLTENNFVWTQTNGPILSYAPYAFGDRSYILTDDEVKEIYAEETTYSILFQNSETVIAVHKDDEGLFPIEMLQLNLSENEVRWTGFMNDGSVNITTSHLLEVKTLEKNDR